MMKESVDPFLHNVLSLSHDILAHDPLQHCCSSLMFAAFVSAQLSEGSC